MPPPVTPQKRGKKSQAKASNGDETPAKKTKTATPGSNSTPVKASPIPATFDEAGPEDRMLLHMKDEGKGWPEIMDALATMTGTKPNLGSLRSRLLRMKNKFVVVEPDHVSLPLRVYLSLQRQGGKLIHSRSSIDRCRFFSRRRRRSRIALNWRSGRRLPMRSLLSVARSILPRSL